MAAVIGMALGPWQLQHGSDCLEEGREEGERGEAETCRFRTEWCHPLGTQSTSPASCTHCRIRLLSPPPAPPPLGPCSSAADQRSNRDAQTETGSCDASKGAARAHEINTQPASPVLTRIVWADAGATGPGSAHRLSGAARNQRFRPCTRAL